MWPWVALVQANMRHMVFIYQEGLSHLYFDALTIVLLLVVDIVSRKP